MEIHVSHLSYHDVFKQYSKFLVEDFTSKVHGLVAASYPIDEQYKKDFISFKSDEIFNQDNTIGQLPINTVTRFVNECVEFALEHFPDNANTREIWNDISNRPSIHHDELQAITYSAATLYDTTIKDVLVGTVMRDAKDVSTNIRNSIASLATNNQSGGRVNAFSWGVLNDGLWLNGALMKAYELSNTFRPGDQVADHYAPTCFDFARSYCEYDQMDRSEVDNINGTVFQALSIAGSDITAENTALSNKFDIAKCLTYSSELEAYLKYWRTGFSNTAVAIDAITTMSSTIRILNAMKEVYRNQTEDDVIISSSINDRVNKMYDVVTLALCGYEALRETQFSDTLIFTAAKDTDGTVDVFVNDDLLRSYRSTGGEEKDLIHMGLYITDTPNRVTPKDGWTMSWATSRRDDVIAEMTAKQSARQEELDRGQLLNIKNTVFNNVYDVVQSYYENAGNGDMKPTPDVVRQINDIAANVVNQNAAPLEQSIYDLLLYVGNRDDVTDMGGKLVNYMSSENPEAKQNAPALTLLSSALEDFSGLILN
jgi:hypothetical protein